MKKLFLLALVGISISSMAESVKTSEKASDLKSVKESRVAKLKLQIQEKQSRRTVKLNLDDSAGKGPKTCKNGSGKCSAEEAESE